MTMWLFMIRLGNPSIEGPFASHAARVKRAREVWQVWFEDHVSGDCFHRLDVDVAGRPTAAPFEEDLEIDADEDVGSTEAEVVPWTRLDMQEPLRHLRRISGLKLAECAERITGDRSKRSTLNTREARGAGASIAALLSYAQAYGLTLDVLVRRGKNPAVPG